MDLTSYTEERMKILDKDLPEEKTADLQPASSEPIILTEEENNRMFHDFSDQKYFEGKFNGSGPVYKFLPPNKNTWIEIKTWSFTDQNELTWLIPQWLTMDAPQGSFQGFSKEEPGKFIYYIEYQDKVETKNGVMHDIKVFRKYA